MLNWFSYLKAGMSRSELSSDQITDHIQAKAPKDALKSLLRFAKPHWLSGVIGASLVIFTSLMAFPQPLINRYLVDDVILQQRMDLLPWAILLYGGVWIINTGAGMLQQYAILNFEQRVTLDIQKTLLKHTLDLPKAFFDKQEVGYLISRISSDVHGLSWFFAGTVVYLFTNIVRFLGGVGFLFYLEWRLALASVVVLPLMVISVKFFSKRMRVISQYGMEQQASIIQRLQETITSLPLIKAFSTERQESERVGDALEGSRQIQMEQHVVNSISGLAINLAPDVAKVIVFVVGAYLAIKGDWTVGSLLAFQAYLGYVFGPAMFFANANLSLQNSLVSLERVMGLFDSVPEENLEAGIAVSRIKGDVEFRNVSFSYGGNESVLQDINFRVKPGEHIAIVGPSGVGKTTLVSLLLCFYKPMLGEILFDGIPFNEYNLPSIRRRIGYVSQSTLLLSGSFNEALKYGNPDATQQEVESAAKAAGIHEFISKLPGGYGARIDERAVNLSEGQKQRLAIARALLKNPDIFILDEPTSSLDSIVESSIFSALPEFVKDKTLIIVAHRLATIQNSDLILVLKDKQLAGSGTHAQLLEENAFYRELVANQQVIGSI